MDWGFILQVTFAVLGAALIVGGFVAYRGSARTGVRAFAAAAIASGVVIVFIVGMTLPLSSTSDGSPDPVIETGGRASAYEVNDAAAATSAR